MGRSAALRFPDVPHCGVSLWAGWSVPPMSKCPVSELCPQLSQDGSLPASGWVLGLVRLCAARPVSVSRTSMSPKMVG